MTGWQGNEGGQGGWQPPPDNQGDPYRQQPYNPDPYGNNTGSQGTAPYPYGPSGGANPYQTGGFPAQSGLGGYGPDPYAQEPYGPYNPYQTGGFPDFSPPPKRSKLPMILGVLAIVIIVGAVVAIVLVNRKGDNQTASPAETSNEQPAPPSGESSGGRPPSSGEPGGQDGWRTVDNVADSGLTYQVPPDWKVTSTPRPSGLNVDFTGTAEYGTYDCEGGTYVRSFATSGDVQSKSGQDLDLNKTVTDFATAFGKGYFKDTATVEPGTPEETEVSGNKAITVTAPVTPKVSNPKCEAAKGEVSIVGVLLEEDGTPAGVAMLAVVSDVEGGPDDPEPLPTDVAKDILASARVG